MQKCNSCIRRGCLRPSSVLESVALFFFVFGPCAINILPLLSPSDACCSPPRHPQNQAVIWCAEAGSTGTQVGTIVDLTIPTTVAGGSTVIKEATLEGGGSYTTEGMVQILGTGSIVDNALVTDYSLRSVHRIYSKSLMTSREAGHMSV